MLTIESITDRLSNRANSLYGGEAVTQLEHALQCASLAEAAGASAGLITAALLHDLGHLGDDHRRPHEELAAQQLVPLFDAAVTEPIRLHVAAKRYLCASDAEYWDTLSAASKHSLARQGGPYTAAQAADFLLQAHALDAVRLRQWDDLAKVPGAATASLPHFVAIMLGTVIPRAALHVA